MNDSSKLKLHSVLNSLEMEAEPVAIELENDLKEIARLEKSIREFSFSISESDYVFSPRRDRGQSEELKQMRSHLEELCKKHEALKNHYEQINQNIELIVEVLSSDDGGSVVNRNGLLYQEQDRQRIARDLHESALSSLSYLGEKIDSGLSFVEKDSLKAKMELSIAKKKLNDTVEEIRNIIFDLRPMIIDANDFCSFILKYVDQFNEKKEYDIVADVEDIFCQDQMILTTIFYIIEECFQNIKKYAEAYSIHLIVQEQIGSYYIYIEDDGKGFDVAQLNQNSRTQFGLNMMKERVELLGGNVIIDSSPNAGTRIKVLIPNR